tara:strand:- start:2119 stop:2355 length:237 start_codon:yes stop_codon:yes gene_type:complete
MFKVEVLERVGIPPLSVDASQVVIRLADGTPVSVAALFGGEESLLVSNAGDPDFNENLNKLGINETVITEKFDTGRHK